MKYVNFHGSIIINDGDDEDRICELFEGAMQGVLLNALGLDYNDQYLEWDFE